MSCSGIDPEAYITEDDRCSSCGLRLDLNEPDAINFEVEERGITPGSPDHPPVHWTVGWITCPNCEVRLPFETSS